MTPGPESIVFGEDRVRAAYEGLSRQHYVRSITTRITDNDGKLLAYNRETVKTARSGKVVERQNIETAGSFKHSFISRWFATRPDTTPAGAFVPAYLPSDPAYLNARTRDEFLHSRAADTLISGQMVAVYQYMRKPDARGEENIRMARLYVIPEINQVIGSQIVYDSDLTFFRENSGYTFFLEIGSDGTWRPSIERVSTTFTTLAGDPRRYERETRYSGFSNDVR